MFRQAYAAIAVLAVAISSAPAAAQSLSYIAGSSGKVQQVIGGQWNVLYCTDSTLGLVLTDGDWQTWAPLPKHDRTFEQRLIPQFGSSSPEALVAGCDLGSNFEGTCPGIGKVLFFLNGDTIYPLENTGQDAMAMSRAVDPAKGFGLAYLPEYGYLDPNGWSTFLIGDHIRQSSAVQGTGPFDVPEAGIGFDQVDDNYVVYSTGYNEKPPQGSNGYDYKYTVLAHFKSNYASNLYGPWDVNPTPLSSNRVAGGGHFIQVSLVHEGDHVWLFGTGQVYRGNNVFLARIDSKSGVGFPNNGLWNFTSSIRYFAGLDGNGNPQWATSESDPAKPMVPVVSDDPAVPNPPACWTPGPTVGNVSVQYDAKLKLWLMTYDGGRQEEQCGDPDHILGIYFSWAKEPWGKWSPPVLIYNPARDGGFGNYISNPDKVLDAKGILISNPFAATAPVGGPYGPVIGQNDPCHTRGAVYAPFMIKRFNKLSSTNVLSVYYTMSTWNPYTVLLMRSDFQYSP